VTWADYQRLLEIRGDRAVPRFTYLEGTLELMSPSQSHEAIKSAIGRLVEVWCLERGIEFSPYGSWTLEDKEVERGVESDECYAVGFDYESGDKPLRPDLAIEIVWTSGGINKLDVYKELSVGEVWIWKQGKIDVFILRGDRYESRAGSTVLPGIDLDQLLGFIAIEPVSRAMREYQTALRRK
jgi:Uma2 family endonuclease